MTKRLKVYLLVIVAAACLACTLVGCSLGGLTREKATAGYNTHITYYSNGGSFNDSATMTVREIFLKGDDDGAPFFEITPETSGMPVKRGAHDFDGWFMPKRYTDGAHAGEIMYYIVENNVKVPVYLLKDGGEIVTDRDTLRPLFAREEDGVLVDDVDKRIPEREVFVECSDEKVTGGEIIAPNRDDWFGLVVCAKWTPFAKINYTLVITDESGNKISDATTEYTTADGKETFKNGELLLGQYMDADTVTPRNTAVKTLNGLTFVKTFADEDLSQNVTPVNKADGDVTVYCRYVLGDWTVVNTSSKVKDMFEGLGDSVNYLITENITYTGLEISARRATVTANAKIVCDGNRTISGLKFIVERVRNNTDNFSIFGTLGENFSVSGLTLKDVSVEISPTTQKFNFYAICGECRDANPDNIKLTVENLTVTYSLYKGSRPFNNDIDSQWLFGGYGIEIDDDFLNRFTGVKLQGTNAITAVD